MAFHGVSIPWMSAELGHVTALIKPVFRYHLAGTPDLDVCMENRDLTLCPILTHYTLYRIIIGQGKGLLPVNTKPLSNPMLVPYRNFSKSFQFKIQLKNVSTRIWHARKFPELCWRHHGYKALEIPENNRRRTIENCSVTCSTLSP